MWWRRPGREEGKGEKEKKSLLGAERRGLPRALPFPSISMGIADRQKTEKKMKIKNIGTTTSEGEWSAAGKPSLSRELQDIGGGPKERSKDGKLGSQKKSIQNHIALGATSPGKD